MQTKQTFECYHWLDPNDPQWIQVYVPALHCSCECCDTHEIERVTKDAIKEALANLGSESKVDLDRTLEPWGGYPVERFQVEIE